MVAQARGPDSPLTQIVMQAREQPLVFDDVRVDLCEDLAQVILTRMQHDHGRRGAGSLNVGGWKSSEDFFQWPDASVQELRQTLIEMLGTSSLTGWTMVNHGGSHHPRHQHRIAILFGVFYVIGGDPIVPTIYECPCDGRPTRTELAVDPVSGRLALARGETWHRLDRYAGDQPRITIAFDVRR